MSNLQNGYGQGIAGAIIGFFFGLGFSSCETTRNVEKIRDKMPDKDASPQVIVKWYRNVGWDWFNTEPDYEYSRP